MGKFITTTEISSAIEKIIKDSQKFLILVSPYIQIHQRLRSIIEKKINSTDVKVFIVSKDNLETDTSKWLNTFGNRIKILIKNNLHAKCYLNENAAIVTSMNLYYYSMVNNIEFGVYFERNSNSESYNAIYEEILDMGIETVENKNLKTKVDIKDLFRDFITTGMSINKEWNDNETLRLFSDSQEKNYVPIKISSDIKLQSTDQVKRIREVIDNYPLYLIENNEEKYFMFFPKS